jgi:beta-mannosidase
VRRFPTEPGELIPLEAGWRLAGTGPRELSGPEGLPGLASVPALVPGTVAGALPDAASLDEQDWWFWTSFSYPPVAPGWQARLWLDGLATVAEVYLDGEGVLHSESMFERHCLVLPEAGGEHRLAICFRALAPLLRERRKPRARWRTRLVDGNLRFWRTMLLGRAPGFAPGPPVVGPWRPVLLERRPLPGVETVSLRPRVGGRVAGLAARVELSGPADRVELRLVGPDDVARSDLHIIGTMATGELRVSDAQRWWPHTHGTPTLYRVELAVRAGREEHVVDAGRIGFRELSWPADLEGEGLALAVNGRPVFARGAVWTPLDLRAPHAGSAALRERLERVRAAGLNMLRVPGTACYESPEFYELCDELGLLVWQDFMFANLDYPESDPAFLATVEREARQVLEDVGGRPSLGVLCGGSEVAQQVAMMGLSPELAEGPLYGQVLPGAIADAGVTVPYVPSTPWGGDLPFRTDRGVANYYGVGAYLRPFTDARLAGVRFAGECLAFANVPDDDALAGLGPPSSEAWKRGVPHDVGADWDFDDVRDHYLAELFECEPIDLRTRDPERFLELSRQVSGEVMAEVFGEWRRAASPTGGGLVLWLADLMPGAGWGLLDHRGEPKVAFHHLRRALAPVAVWSTDEGLGGVDAHVANDRDRPLEALLRMALYRDLEVRMEEVSIELGLGPGETVRFGIEELLGRFVDASFAYRFGPPGHDLIVLSLESAEGELLSQACRFPVGRPLDRQPASELGVSARVVESDRIEVRSRRLLYGARLSVAGWEPLDDAFCVEPGRAYEVAFRPVEAGSGGRLRGGMLRALNLEGSVAVGE